MDEVNDDTPPTDMVYAAEVRPGMMVAESRFGAEERLVTAVRPATEVDMVTLPVLRRPGLDEIPTVIYRAAGETKRSRVRFVPFEVDLIERGDVDTYVVLGFEDGSEQVVARMYQLHRR